MYRDSSSSQGQCLPRTQKNNLKAWICRTRHALYFLSLSSLYDLSHEHAKMRASRAVAVLSDGRIFSSSPGAKLLSLSCRQTSSEASRKWQKPAQFDCARTFSQSAKRSALSAAQEALVLSIGFIHNTADWLTIFSIQFESCKRSCELVPGSCERAHEPRGKEAPFYGSKHWYCGMRAALGRRKANQAAY